LGWPYTAWPNMARPNLVGLGAVDWTRSVHRPHRSLPSLLSRTLLSFLWRRRAASVSCPLPAHSGAGDVGLWSASTCSTNSSRSIYFSLAPSLARPQPRNPSRCRLIRPSPASPGIIPCRRGSSTNFTINNRCLDAVLLPHAALPTANPSHEA
jgi:hypothetical protein